VKLFGPDGKEGFVYENNLFQPILGPYRNDHNPKWDKDYTATLIIALNYQSGTISHIKNQYLQGFFCIDCKATGDTEPIFRQEIIQLMDIISKLCYSMIGINIEGKKLKL